MVCGVDEDDAVADDATEQFLLRSRTQTQIRSPARRGH